MPTWKKTPSFRINKFGSVDNVWQRHPAVEQLVMKVYHIICEPAKQSSEKQSRHCGLDPKSLCMQEFLNQVQDSYR